MELAAIERSHQVRQRSQRIGARRYAAFLKHRSGGFFLRKSSPAYEYFDQLSPAWLTLDQRLEPLASSIPCCLTVDRGRSPNVTENGTPQFANCSFHG
jgi:hypothetical protein